MGWEVWLLVSATDFAECHWPSPVLPRAAEQTVDTGRVSVLALLVSSRRQRFV